MAMAGAIRAVLEAGAPPQIVVRVREELLVLCQEYVRRNRCGRTEDARRRKLGCFGLLVERSGGICGHHRNDPISREVNEIVQIARRDRPEYV
jgi:hypothetical protein